jgi:hypothetical protein
MTRKQNKISIAAGENPDTRKQNKIRTGENPDTHGPLSRNIMSVQVLKK